MSHIHMTKSTTTAHISPAFILLAHCPLQFDHSARPVEHARLLYQKVQQHGLPQGSRLRALRSGMRGGGRVGTLQFMGLLSTERASLGGKCLAMHACRRDALGEPIFVDIGAPISTTYQRWNSIAFEPKETITEIVSGIISLWTQSSRCHWLPGQAAPKVFEGNFPLKEGRKGVCAVSSWAHRPFSSLVCAENYQQRLPASTPLHAQARAIRWPDTHHRPLTHHRPQCRAFKTWGGLASQELPLPMARC